MSTEPVSAAWEGRARRWAVRYSVDGGRSFRTEGPFGRGQAAARRRELLFGPGDVWGLRVEPRDGSLLPHAERPGAFA